MTDKTLPSNPLRLRLIDQAAVNAGTDNHNERMKAAGKRALKFAQKAMREGKAGLVTDGESVAIIER